MPLSEPQPQPTHDTMNTHTHTHTAQCELCDHIGPVVDGPHAQSGDVIAGDGEQPTLCSDCWDDCDNRVDRAIAALHGRR